MTPYRICSMVWYPRYILQEGHRRELLPAEVGLLSNNQLPVLFFTVVINLSHKPRLSITDLSRSLGQTWSGKPGFEASRILPADRDKDGSSYSNESCETLPHIVPDTSGEYGPEGARTSTQSHGVQTLRKSYTTQLQQLQYIWPQSWTMGSINP